MKKAIAIGFTVLAAAAYLIGYMASRGESSGPLNYIFVVILGLPWTAIISWLIPSVDSPLIPAVGVSINTSLVWWWALRGRRST
ncbi:MAG: hypothetical protein AB7Q37_14230 [Pyrinomonadaceae bacterium]